VLLAYAAGFLAFPPRVLLIVDEFNYVTQAVAFAQGALTIPGGEPLFPAQTLGVASNYPPGTSLLQAPLVAIGGWRAAAALSVLGVIVTTLVTMKWLRENDRHPAFSLVIPAFLGTLFFGRVAMSDAPTAAIVALALWLLWRADQGWVWSFAAGLTAGATLLFREPPAVLLTPFLVGAVARRKCVVWALVLGGVVAVAARLVLFHELFGSALYVRDSGYGFSPESALANLPQYTVILVLMFPLGAILPFLYRGPRRAEVVTALGMYVATFLFYDYDSVRENGMVRGILLASRFMLPALPLLAFMAADVFPRLFGSRARWLGAARVIGFVALAAVAFAIHPALQRQEQGAATIVADIQRATTEPIPVITNHHATLKYLSPIYGPRRLILRSSIDAGAVPAFLRNYGKLSLVFLDRTDTETFRQDAMQNDVFLGGLRQRCRVVPALESQHGPSLRLRVFDVVSCGA
jgi:hypothetical protein